jgi:hypothetical protein
MKTLIHTARVKVAALFAMLFAWIYPFPAGLGQVGTEYTGDDDEETGDDDEILGAIRRDQRAKQGARRPAPGAARPVGAAGKPRPQANINPTALRVPMGVGTHFWAATEVDEVLFEVEPQRDFTPDRMVVDVAKDVLDAAILVNITSIKVGDMPQNPNDSVPLPAIMFASNATDAHVQFDTVKASRKLLVKAAPTDVVTAGVTIQIGMYGWMVRGSQG